MYIGKPVYIHVYVYIHLHTLNVIQQKFIEFLCQAFCAKTVKIQRQMNAFLTMKDLQLDWRGNIRLAF